MYGTARVLRRIAAEREYDASIFVALELRSIELAASRERAA
jgi:hypothetical protein